LVELVSDYHEGVLPEPALSLLEEHLVICEPCLTYPEQIRLTIEALGTIRSEEALARPSQAILGALRLRDDRPR
jgi:hypothetical protein